MVEGDLKGHAFTFSLLKDTKGPIAEVFGFEIESPSLDTFLLEYSLEYESLLNVILPIVVITALDSHL